MRRRRRFLLPGAGLRGNDVADAAGASCVGCILIKASAPNLAKLANRLREIAMGYFSGRPPGMVMGIVASDAAPEKKSDICTRGKRFPAYQFTHPKWCPIFILFSREGGVFRPHFAAIEAMVWLLDVAEGMSAPSFFHW